MTTATPSVKRLRPNALNNVGTVPTASAALGVRAEEYGEGIVRQTVFTLTSVPLTLTNALAYASLQLYDFPEGRIHVLDTVCTITVTTTTAIATTLLTAKAVSWGLGSAAASSLTLATTMQNFMPGSGEAVNTFTSSTVINVAPAADTGILAAVSAAHLAAIVDGTTTAADLFLNFGVAAADIDGDAGLSITGTFYVTWMNTGDR